MNRLVQDKDINSIVMYPKDNVATLLQEMTMGNVLIYELQGDCQSLKIQQDTPLGHKVAIHNINPGENIVKYGEVIGSATVTIKCGEHVHVHNIESNRGRGDKV